MSPNMEIDFTKVEQIADGDQDLLRDLLDAFEKELDVFLRQVKDGVTGKDCEAIDRGLHRMKSSIGYFGVPKLTQLTTSLMREVDAESDQVSNNQTKVIHYVKTLKREVSEYKRVI